LGWQRAGLFAAVICAASLCAFALGRNEPGGLLIIILAEICLLSLVPLLRQRMGAHLLLAFNAALAAFTSLGPVGLV
jgi:hypothetical protein